MTSYTAAKAQAHFTELVDRVAKNRESARITRGRKVVAAVVPPEDFELLQRIRAEEDAEDIREADKAMKRYERTGKAIPWETIKKANKLK